MILVDTSVWIRFLAGREPFCTEMDRLLSLELVAGHELVQGELLIGDPGGRSGLLDFYALLHPAPVISHTEIVAFVQARKLNGKGIGWIDAHLLASALVADIPLWTADSRLATLAEDLGINYSLT